MSKIKQNFIYDAAYQIFILIIPFITTPYIARVLGATGVGIYSYTYSIVNYFMMFAILGINTYGNREVSKIKDNKEKLNYTFSSIYYLQIICTVIIFSIYLIYCLNFNREYFFYNLIQTIYILSVAFDINWLFCGLQKFKVTVTRSFFIKISSFIAILLFVKNENDLWKYIIILAMSTLINQIVLWPFLKKECKFVRVKPKDILKHLKPNLLLFIPTIALSVYRIFDKIMIGQIISVTEVGYYENAEKMLNIVLAIVSALVTVTLPEMTYLYNNKRFDEFYKILKKSVLFIYFMAIPVIFGFLATSKNLVSIYLGNNFSKSALILNVLCISLIFSPISSIIRMQILIPQNRDKEYIISIICGAILNVILNLLLIKKLEAIGAAISTVIAELIVFLLQYYYVKNEIKIKDYIYSIIKFLTSSIIMYIVVVVIGNIINTDLIKLVVQIGVGIIIYLFLNYKFIKSNINMNTILSKVRKK